jgi:hypothetical protein
MRFPRSLFVSSLAALSIAFALPASAQNLVVNGDFELDSNVAIGFTEGGGGNLAGVNPNFGVGGSNFYSFAATNGQNNTLSQTITTVAGQSYTVSYFLRNSVTGNDFFLSSFAGQTLQTLENTTSIFNFTQFTFQVTATSSTSVLEFAGRDAPGSFRLDNVSVVANVVNAPEPASVALALLALPIVGVALRKRRAQNG